ncbi:MAG TPA: ABC transporter ATP-binding protein [Bdellovibrionota bacterium]|jgi:subfamily B ATP-binding cassette protein MsbA|nr:ABC transporter ATP-binding protein [Bdellovibrionota bacterium]
MDSKEIRSFLWDHIRPHKKWLISSAFFGILLAGMTLGLVNNLRPLLDDALAKRDFSQVVYVSVMFVVFIFGDGLFSYLHRMCLRIGVERLLMDIKNRIYRRVLVSSQSRMARTDSGQVVTLLFNDTSVIGQGLHIVSDIVREPPTIIALVGYLFYLNWQLTLFCIFVLPVIAFISKKLGESSRRNQRRIQIAIEGASQHSLESIQGLRTAHSFGRISLLKNEFYDRTMQSYRPALRQASVQEVSAPIVKLLFAFAGAGILLVSGYYVARGQMTPGEFAAYMAAAFSLPSPVRALNHAYVRLQEIYVAADRIRNLVTQDLDEVSRAQTSLLDQDIANRACAKDPMPLRLNNVSFAYSPDSNGPRAIESVSLHLEPGKKLALVGPSGSGKSTLSLLLMRYIDPSSGQVLLGSKDARDWSVEAYRSNFSYVSQDVFLFSKSLRDNLLFAAPDATDEQLWSALEQARLKTFVESLPQKLDTVIQERATNLSGGEKQRIAIARAILRNAPIIILDEATSQLDIENERLIQQAMDSLMHGKSVIIIAHRLSTVKEVDEILVLDRGHVVERGAPQDLISQPESWFSRMWSSQSYTS